MRLTNKRWRTGAALAIPQGRSLPLCRFILHVSEGTGPAWDRSVDDWMPNNDLGLRLRSVGSPTPLPVAVSDLIEIDARKCIPQSPNPRYIVAFQMRQSGIR